jgi:hypothetical protein
MEAAFAEPLFAMSSAELDHDVNKRPNITLPEFGWNKNAVCCSWSMYASENQPACLPKPSPLGA